MCTDLYQTEYRIARVATLSVFMAYSRCPMFV